MFLARRFFAIAVFLVAASTAAGAATIEWEATDRFRFFKNEKDFQRHVDKFARVKDQTRRVLSTERLFYEDDEFKKDGWASKVVDHVCWNRWNDKLLTTCHRNDKTESYLNPQTIAIKLTLKDAPPSANCRWVVRGHNKQLLRDTTQPCEREVRLPLPVPYRTTDINAYAEVHIVGSSEKPITSEQPFRHVRIAGIGDSIASGEGNPDKPVNFANTPENENAIRANICFMRSEALRDNDNTPDGETHDYFRPARTKFNGDGNCERTPLNDHNRNSQLAQVKQAYLSNHAHWLSAACHRSLYGNQMRSALQVAIENKHMVVTFMPLGCTGATIDQGLLGEKKPRELYCAAPRNCIARVEPQISVLRSYWQEIKQPIGAPEFDAILLTIGANDMGFAELVASTILRVGTRHTDLTEFLRKNNIFLLSLPEAKKNMELLPRNFARLREALSPLVANNLLRVVFVAYPNPATIAGDAPCGPGRAGMDIHPQFYANGEVLKNTWEFTKKDFFDEIKRLATCPTDGACEKKFTFVDTHQPSFIGRGFCVRGSEDPEFDRRCFTENGDAFNAKGDFRCGRPANQYRAYVSRQRWIRSPNDSYFAANTFPDRAAFLLSDPMNLIFASTYGGAFHPTAEGHAAIADEVVPKLQEVLKIRK